MIKTLGSRTGGYILNIINIVYMKNPQPTPSPSKSGMRQGFSLSPFLLNIALEVLARTVRQE